MEIEHRTATTYLMPLRRPPGAGPLDDELASYLKSLTGRCEVIVVDGSADDEFDAAHRGLSHAVHVRPDGDVRCANGKVRGVLSGLRRVRTPLVVIADDDVRYDDAGLDRVEALLERYDVVVPQNFFDPRPWHAVWDTGRTLLNRCAGADFPGTVALRAAVLERTNGYDGDVLFENLELLRTARAAGADVVAPLDLFVRRLPPTTTKFFEQRVRQAYDEFARPLHLALGLATVPVAFASARRPRRLLAGVLAIVGVAEVGRRRAGGRAVFPLAASLCAPLWVTERGVCSWVALVHRLTGGCPYAGRRLRRAATSPRALARRHAQARARYAAATPG